jgi:hypothetical protein
MSRFLYLNIYAFLIVFAGILTLILPFYLITKWILIAQGIAAVSLFLISGKLFSTWNAKKKEIELLVNRNKNEFRPDTFEVYMQTLCGRLVVHEVLRELNKQREYKTLLKLQKPLLKRLKKI